MSQTNDSDLVGTAVVDRDGRRGRIVAPPASPAAASSAEDDSAVLIEFAHGRTVLIGRGFLVLETDGTLRLPMGVDELDSLLDEPATRDVWIDETEVIPLAEEQVRVTKRRVVTGGVRVRKHVREWEEVVDEPLTRVRVDVERRPVNVWADTPPPVRTEGDTIVVPLLEEVVVAERRLRVTEEVRITRRRESFRAPQRVVLRREEAEVERVAAEEAGETGEFESE
jgi:uncharacterized protein (TIGR02271 family)